MAIVCAYAAPVEAGGLVEELPGVEFLELGVGKTAAAWAVTRRLCAGPRPGLVLLFGVAGAYPGAGLQVGDLCVVREECFGDEGVATATEFLDLAALGLGEIGPFAMADAPTALAAAELGGVARVRGATVSACAGTDEVAAERAARTGAAVETMEGAAVAWCCAREGVDVVQVRAISNECGFRDEGRWDLPGACARVQDAVRRLLAGGRLR